ncbi:MAG: hypothetical protein ABIN94_01010 [Ferruginibacter sp.]
MKVLSIGPNKSMSYLIWTVLSNLYRLIIVENVFEGMHFLKNQRDIRLIIVDIDYQTKETIDFIHHINSSKIYKKPFIILTNPQNQKLNKSVLEQGAYCCFIKPFNPLELANCIKQLSLSTSLNE